MTASTLAVWVGSWARKRRRRSAALVESQSASKSARLLQNGFSLGWAGGGALYARC